MNLTAKIFKNVNCSTQQIVVPATSIEDVKTYYHADADVVVC